MPEIRSKVVETEALQWDGTEDNAYAIAAWANSYVLEHPVEIEDYSADKVAIYSQPIDKSYESSFVVLTPSGWVEVPPGHWVIRDSRGLPYPCDPITFEARWEVEIP